MIVLSIVKRIRPQEHHRAGPFFGEEANLADAGSANEIGAHDFKTLTVRADHSAIADRVRGQPNRTLRLALRPHDSNVPRRYPLRLFG